MSQGGYSMRRVLPDDTEAILDLIIRIFGQGDADGTERTREWFEWKYPGNPAGHQSLVAQDAEGRIVGFYGGVTLPVSADGESWQFGQAVDTCTDPRVRRGLRNPGLFVRLAQAYLSTTAQPGRDVVGYGLPMPEAYRMGSRFLDYWMLRSQYLLVCTSAGQLPPEDKDAVAEDVTSFTEESDDLLGALAAERRCLAKRDRAFLDWRFAHHPQRPYRIVLARGAVDGRLRGHVVVRPGFVQGRRTAVIMDWLCRDADGAAAAALVRSAGRIAMESGLDSVMMLLPTADRWFEQFQTWGFRAEPSAYVMVARSVHERFQPDYLREHWYYTQADFDLL